MGYGKTTAVNWFLAGRIKALNAVIIRVNIYSDNLSLFWKSVCGAFSDAGIAFPADYPIPKDAVSAGLLTDELCRVLSGNVPYYIFIDDFHLLKSDRAAAFICNIAKVLPRNVHIIVASRDTFPKKSDKVCLVSKLHTIDKELLRLNHTELSVFAERCGLTLDDDVVDAMLNISEGWFSAIYFALRSYAETGRLPEGTHDIYELFMSTLLDTLPKNTRTFIAAMGLADEFTTGMAEYITERQDIGSVLSALTEQNSFVVRLPDGATYRFHHILKECAKRYFDRLDEKDRHRYMKRCGEWYEEHKEYYNAVKMFHDCGERVPMLRVIGKDRAEQLSFFASETVVGYISECGDKELCQEPYALLVLMRRYFSWRMMPEMLRIRDLLTETVTADKGISEEERNNILGECDLVMSFTAYNDIHKMSEYHRSACEKMTCTSRTMGKMGTWTFGSPSVLALFHRTSGGLDDELAVMHESMPYYYKLTYGHGSGAEYVMQAEAEYLRGDMTNALISLEKAVQSAADNGQVFILACCDFLKMRISLFGKDCAMPYKHSAESTARCANPVLITVYDVCAGYYNALVARSEKTAQWLMKENGADILFPAKPVIELIRNRIMLAGGEYTKVIARHDTIMKISNVYPYELCKLYLALQTASAYMALGQREKALEYLGQAVSGAEPDGIIIPFAEYYEYLGELLPDKLADNVSPFAERFTRNITELRSASLGSAAIDDLSAREKDIALLIGDGLRNKDISEKLHLTEGSVKQYINRIYGKLMLDGTAAEKRRKLIEILKC